MVAPAARPAQRRDHAADVAWDRGRRGRDGDRARCCCSTPALPGGLIDGDGDIRYARTMAFNTLVLFQLVGVFCIRSDDAARSRTSSSPTAGCGCRSLPAWRCSWPCSTSRRCSLRSGRWRSRCATGSSASRSRARSSLPAKSSRRSGAASIDARRRLELPARAAGSRRGWPVRPRAPSVGRARVAYAAPVHGIECGPVPGW